MIDCQPHPYTSREAYRCYFDSFYLSEWFDE